MKSLVSFMYTVSLGGAFFAAVDESNFEDLISTIMLADDKLEDTQALISSISCSNLSAQEDQQTLSTQQTDLILTVGALTSE